MATDASEILRGPRRPFGRRGPLDVVLEPIFPGFYRRGDVTAAQLAAETGLSPEQIMAIAGVASPLSQIRNLERVYRAIETMGGTVRRTALSEGPALSSAVREAGVLPERYSLEFLRNLSAEGLAHPGRVTALQSFPEQLALTLSRGRERSPAIVQDVPSQILNALRFVFGQRGQSEFVRRKALRR